MSIELSFVRAKEIALCSLPVEIVLSDIGSLPITNWGKPEWGTGVLKIEQLKNKTPDSEPSRFLFLSLAFSAK